MEEHKQQFISRQRMREEEELRDLQVWTMISSLRIWEDEKLKDVQANHPPKVGTTACPCCLRWNYSIYPCGLCPIYLYTGKTGCRGTPYTAIEEALETAVNYKWLEPDVRDEIDFLQEVTQALLGNY